jgi:glycosyltransferase involved in cell wall biosynthesis
MRLAVVIPVFNEAESLPGLLTELERVLGGIGHDSTMFVIDDGSSDGSADVAREHGATVIRSGRNVGKSAALQAGFDATRDFDVVVTMDGDLQDDPSEVPRMLKELEGHDLVNGWKVSRQDSSTRRLQSRIFGAFVRFLTDLDLNDINSGFKAYRREVLDSIRLTGDQHRLIPLLAHNAGFSVGEIAVNHRPRLHGSSRFGVIRAFRGPMDLITVLFLSKYGQRPLHFLGGTGLVVGAVGLLLGIYLSWLRLVEGQSIGDRPLLLLAVLLIVTGIQLFVSGLIGELILKTRSVSPPSPFRRY